MNVILVGLTLLVLAGVLIACVALGSDRFAAAQHVSRDGIEVLPPARGPLEGPWREAREGAEAAVPDAAGAGPAGPTEAGPAGAAPAGAAPSAAASPGTAPSGIARSADDPSDAGSATAGPADGRAGA